VDHPQPRLIPIRRGGVRPVVSYFYPTLS
jgi:hypothetical protein